MANNNNDLENRLWGAADELRANSKLKSSEYSIPVLGLIFLRYADVKFAEAEKQVAGQGGGRRAAPFVHGHPGSRCRKLPRRAAGVRGGDEER